MAGNSSIEWTEATWNPIAGCSIVSPGCTNCYAMRIAARLQAMGQPKYQGTTRKSGERWIWTGHVGFKEDTLNIPKHWKTPKKIFVNSMSDLFQKAVSVARIQLIWNVMSEADWHIYQILTKRPDRMARVLKESSFKVLPQIWLGTSVESADFIDRIDDLRSTPAKVRFLSLEPLLGSMGELDLTDIDWVIVGGESGPNSRPMEKNWVEEIQQQCEEQGVAFFFKQWGGRNKKKAGRILNERTWDNYPRVANLAH